MLFARLERMAGESKRSQLVLTPLSGLFPERAHCLSDQSLPERRVALPFSIEALKPTGEAFPIAEDVGAPSVTADGTLVCVDLFGVGQRATGVAGPRRQPTRRDRPAPRRAFAFPVLSPDGRRVAVRSTESGNIDVWVHEVDPAMRRRLTFDPAVDSIPQWSPSGNEITFLSIRQGNFDIFSRPSDGTGEPVLLVGTELNEVPYDWSADGKYLFYTVADPENGLDLCYLKRKEDGSGFEPFPFLQMPFNEGTPKISPDGRFMAYCSDEWGQFEIHVQPFPEGRGNWPVSTNGGCQPRWSRDGKDLFYVAGDTLLAVAVTTTPSFSFSVPTPLFRNPNLVAANCNQILYDVSADASGLS